LNNVRKVRDIPVPFPYAQMTTIFLFLHCIATILGSAVIVDYWPFAAIITFISVTAYVGTYYIALEIEQPFGDGGNSLPVDMFMKDMNRSLRTLLMPHAQQPPYFAFDELSVTSSRSKKFTRIISVGELNCAYRSRQGKRCSRFNLDLAPSAPETDDGSDDDDEPEETSAHSELAGLSAGMLAAADVVHKSSKETHIPLLDISPSISESASWGRMRPLDVGPGLDLVDSNSNSAGLLRRERPDKVNVELCIANKNGNAFSAFQAEQEVGDFSSLDGGVRDGHHSKADAIHHSDVDLRRLEHPLETRDVSSARGYR